MKTKLIYTTIYRYYCDLVVSFLILFIVLQFISCKKQTIQTKEKEKLVVRSAEDRNTITGYKNYVSDRTVLFVKFKDELIKTLDNSPNSDTLKKFIRKDFIYFDESSNTKVSFDGTNFSDNNWVTSRVKYLTTILQNMKCETSVFEYGSPDVYSCFRDNKTNIQSEPFSVSYYGVTFKTNKSNVQLRPFTVDFVFRGDKWWIQLIVVQENF